MTNAVTGDRDVIQLKPRGGMTAAEAEAFLAERIQEAKTLSKPTAPSWRRFKTNAEAWRWIDRRSGDPSCT
jgi:hypothetical protein